MSHSALPVPDLTVCDREPILWPGTIQPHGVLFALEPGELRILQSSENCRDYLGVQHECAVGTTLDSLLDEPSLAALKPGLERADLDRNPLLISTVTVAQNRRIFRAIAHRLDDVLFLELEPLEGREDVAPADLYPFVRSFMSQLRSTASLTDLAQLATNEVRRLTGFERVLVYRFAPNWDGTVIAESRGPFYPSLLDLRFPASDIPAQARALYALSRVRLIADASYKPVPVRPAMDPKTGKALDMSYVSLRSVSPVHLEYLRNMSVSASMSISLLTKDGSLWGLIACHHNHPRVVPFDIRTACDLLGQALSVQIEATEQRLEYENKIRLKSAIARLLAAMAQKDSFLDALSGSPDEMLSFAQSDGVAVIYDGRVSASGVCPNEELIWRLIDWLIASGRQEVFATDRLSTEIPDGDLYRERASGVLAIPISRIHRSYVLWFRREVIQTVRWSGEPGKTAGQDGLRLHPRKSFDAWKETVRGQSLAWTSVEMEAANDLRNAIVGIVLRKAEEKAELSSELQRSNRELEAFSYSISHDLRAPFRHIIGYAGLLKDSQNLADSDRRYVEIITRSAHFAGSLVDNLLHYSQVGRTKLRTSEVNTRVLVEEVRRDLAQDFKDRQVIWNVGELPVVSGDVVLLRLVFENILNNALKYTRSRPVAQVSIMCERKDNEWIFSVSDNGVGFDGAYAGKLFGVFQRLHRMEDFDGTGIGLANVRRVIEKHGGRTWAEGSLGKGARVYFTLPGSAERDAEEVHA